MSPADTIAAQHVDVRALVHLLAEGIGTDAAALHIRACLALKRGVHRVSFDADDRPGSVIVKRTSPEIARRNRLVSDRWLPAAGMGDAAPGTYGILTDPDPSCVWLVSEDLGEHTFASRPREAARTRAAIERIAELHRRFAEHAVLGEVRHWGGDLGPAFHLGNLRDAIRALRALARSRVDATGPRARTRERLLARLEELILHAPARAETLARRGGPETLLHGDLWLENLVEVPADVAGDVAGAARGEVPGAARPAIALIDWDHAAVGPALYDVSTFLYRFPRDERRGLWARYAAALGDGPWWLPDEADLALLCETAEHARIANRVIWPALAALRGEGDDHLEQLHEVAGWFDALEPLFP
ncbi:MAG: phosphotransferase family protein [Planctomycetota bacterium]|jgi:hypothetical protein